MPSVLTGEESQPLRFVEILKSSTFRLAAFLALLFALFSFLLFAFIYWQTVVAETTRIEQGLAGELSHMVKFNEADLARAIKEWLSSPAHRLNYAALFDKSGLRVSGNVQLLPNFIDLDQTDGSGQAFDWADTVVEGERVMMVRHIMGDGRTLVIGRSIDSLDNLEAVIYHALALGIVPATILALVIGGVISRQAHAQLNIVLKSLDRIMKGNLKERLPVRSSNSDFDRLSRGVNFMLDEIERLLEDAQSTGDNIAHDIRTPLTRVRTRLERACASTRSYDELRIMVERAITGLDQALRIVTALLRIGHIENNQRRRYFCSVDLRELIREIGDLFEPIAEEKNINFIVKDCSSQCVDGDRNMLSEAIANLVDNALKFTPYGGHVLLELVDMGGYSVVRVIDDGPGINPGEIEHIWNRFYRSDKSRHVDGNGLGLSIVKAIVGLHGYRVSARNLSPGCAFEISCRRTGNAGAVPMALTA